MLSKTLRFPFSIEFCEALRVEWGDSTPGRSAILIINNPTSGDRIHNRRFTLTPLCPAPLNKIIYILHIFYVQLSTHCVLSGGTQLDIITEKIYPFPRMGEELTTSAFRVKCRVAIGRIDVKRSVLSLTRITSHIT